MSSSPSRTSPVSSGATNKPCVLFEELWTRLRECHHNAIQELEAKVGKLKRERCLDAQKLEEFYSRNQQLKEEQRSLRDTVSSLEERLREQVCDRCALLQENLTTKQTEYEKSRQQNLHLIDSLKSEKTSLRDENLRLSTELEKLKASVSEPQHSTSPDQEDYMIPDSPVMPSSHPLASKLKRRKKHCDAKIRYAETPLPQSRSMLLNGLDQELLEASSRNHKKELILVPETCQMDTSQSARDFDHNLEEVITETCALELPACQPEEEVAAPQINLIPPSKCKLNLRPHSVSRPPSSTSAHYSQSALGESPSLLAHSKRPSGDGPLSRTKRKKVEAYHEQAEEDGTLIPPRAASPATPHVTQQPPHHRLTKVGPYNGAPSETSDAVLVRHAARNPISRANQEASRDPHVATDLPSPDHDEGGHAVEPLWSMDPACALSMYYTQSLAAVKEEPVSQNEPADPDCTFVSHSLLQCQRPCNQDDHEDYDDEEDEEEEGIPPGPCLKANDSMDNMFDATAYGEYNSCNSTHLDQTQPAHEEADEENDQKARKPMFAHMAVVRKKDERRKLKGSTCKECDIYYAHLPEDERQKKLSACSRHRFLYIPPSTPENFWEVGFPSTQTCIDRGYIKEETNPQARLRRRQPLTALFSPKREGQDT